jgi:NAD(P)H-flavin reductase
MAGVIDRFTLAIKRYPGGAVTGALARLRIGDYLAMAGPIVANKSDLSKVTRCVIQTHILTM